jgi:hypothetical protein
MSARRTARPETGWQKERKMLRRTLFATLSLLATAIAAAGCTPAEPLDPDVERLGRATGPSGVGSGSMPPAMPGRVASGDPGERPVYEGEVVETMNVPNYTYLKLRMASGKALWAAVPQFAAKTGETLEVAESLVMTKFTSPSLGRTFDEIIFGTLVPGDAGTPEATSPTPGLPPGHPPIDGRDPSAR